MTNQSSIEYISSLLRSPETITDGDQSSIALFRQTFPYFVPVRYIAALEKHKKTDFSPAMLSGIQPYLGNWLLFCDFLTKGKNSPAEDAWKVATDELQVIKVTDKKKAGYSEKSEEAGATAKKETDIFGNITYDPPKAVESSEQSIIEVGDETMEDFEIPMGGNFSAVQPMSAVYDEISNVEETAVSQAYGHGEEAIGEPEPSSNTITAVSDVVPDSVIGESTPVAVELIENTTVLEETIPAQVLVEAPLVELTELLPADATNVQDESVSPVEEIIPDETLITNTETADEPVIPSKIIVDPINEDQESDVEDFAVALAPVKVDVEKLQVSADDAAIENVVQTPLAPYTPPEDNTEPVVPAEIVEEVKEELIYPVYTEDYFLQQGVKVSEELPTTDAPLPPVDKEEEDKSLMIVMSFSEWLMHFKNTADKQEEEKKDQKALKTMWQKEKLAAAMEEEDEEIPENVFEMAVNSITKENGLASESLADIYIKQGKYDKAIEMYRKLSLRNPKKNAYFARRIEEILKEKQS